MFNHKYISFIFLQQTHEKTYSTPDEENLRMTIFHKNKEMIEEHNKKYEQGLVSYSLKMNHFGDLVYYLLIITDIYQFYNSILTMIFSATTRI